MKKLTVFAAALLTAGLAMAADTGLTREQVQQELAQARANGEFARLTSEDPGAYLPAKAAPSRTRAEVRAELKKAQETGELAALNRDSGLAHTTIQTRKPVKTTASAE